MNWTLEYKNHYENLYVVSIEDFVIISANIPRAICSDATCIREYYYAIQRNKVSVTLISLCLLLYAINTS